MNRCRTKGLTFRCSFFSMGFDGVGSFTSSHAGEVGKRDDVSSVRVELSQISELRGGVSGVLAISFCGFLFLVTGSDSTEDVAYLPVAVAPNHQFHEVKLINLFQFSCTICVQ